MISTSPRKLCLETCTCTLGQLVARALQSITQDNNIIYEYVSTSNEDSFEVELDHQLHVNSQDLELEETRTQNVLEERRNNPHTLRLPKLKTNVQLSEITEGNEKFVVFRLENVECPAHQPDQIQQYPF